jgi:hypothetical protein
MTAFLARTVTFCFNGQTRTMPAGTEVYAKVREGKKTIRVLIPGTLFYQDVYASAIIPA